MKPYLYFKGLQELVAEMNGDERIHIGIRPYGFHAGNAMALFVYPYLMCKYLEQSGKKAKLTFVISINDWEQDCLAGPDPRRFPFNIFPKNSSLQFTADDNGCCESTVDHWLPIIQNSVGQLQNEFPDIALEFIKNSELKNHPHFQKLVIETLRNPMDQMEIFRKYSNKETLPTPISYGGVICPGCHRSNGQTKVLEGDHIGWTCADCKHIQTGEYAQFDYWWYHKPMLVARLMIYNVDITLSGGDHFSEGDFHIRKAFIDRYCPDVKEPKMLFTPTVLALDGQKMSKSRNNAAFADIQKLIQVTDGFLGSEIQITKDLILQEIDEKEYISCV